ncbi:MAG: hypothetical protein AAB664_03905 [Patescibacteria group bacterium]
MKRIFLFSLLVISVAFFGFGCVKRSTNQPSDAPSVEIDRRSIIEDAKKQGLIMNSDEVEKMKDPNILFQDVHAQKTIDLKSLLALDVKSWRAGALADVTGGTSFGLVHTQMQTGRFTLIATLGGLPKTANGAFYQSWLVKRGSAMQLIPTGIVEAAADHFVNAYVTTTNLSDYNFYVVTLQSKSDELIPGEPILEGEIR